MLALYCITLDLKSVYNSDLQLLLRLLILRVDKQIGVVVMKSVGDFAHDVENLIGCLLYLFMTCVLLHSKILAVYIEPSSQIHCFI